MPSIGATTASALYPGESGFFGIWLDIHEDQFSTYSCGYDAQTMDGEQAPAAKLELAGEIELDADFRGDLVYRGRVKNTGTMAMVGARIGFITYDNAGSIIDITTEYIDGETVHIPGSRTTHDALSVNAKGDFEAPTYFVPPSPYASHDTFFTWDDYDGVFWGTYGDDTSSQSLSDDANALDRREDRRIKTADLEQQYLRAKEH